MSAAGIPTHPDGVGPSPSTHVPVIGVCRSPHSHQALMGPSPQCGQDWSSLGSGGSGGTHGPLLPGAPVLPAPPPQVPPETREGLTETLSHAWDSTYPKRLQSSIPQPNLNVVPKKGCLLRGEVIYTKSLPEPLNPKLYLLRFLKLFPSLEIIKVCEIPTMPGNLGHAVIRKPAASA